MCDGKLTSIGASSTNKTRTGSDSASSTSVSSSSSSSSAPWRQEQPPKSSQHNLTRLAFCASGICGCYLYYGILQERLFTTATVTSDDPSQLPPRLGPTFALVTACLTNVAVALLWKRVNQLLVSKQSRDTGEKTSEESPSLPLRLPLPHKLLLATAGCYVAAMACSNEAIPYVSYPVAVLAKSCKLIPTMIVGHFVERQRTHAWQEWVAAVLISIGIVLFQISRLFDGSTTSTNSTKNGGSTSYGMILLLVSLLSDGLLSSCQNFLKHPPMRTGPGNSSSTGNPTVRVPTAVETMLFINMYALVYLIPLSLWSQQWWDGIALLSNYPHVAKTVAILNATVGIGQIFIFLTIAWYSPVICTTITTTRKFVTILLSVWTFGHVFTMLQWTAIVLVFCGLYFAIAMVNHQPTQQERALKSKTKVS